MTTETEVRTGPLTKTELIDRVIQRMGPNSLKKWQVEAILTAAIDEICDALADRRGLKLLHRFAITLRLRKGRTVKVPDAINGDMKPVEVPDKWEAKIKLGDWVAKRVQLGKRPNFWTKYST